MFGLFSNESREKAVDGIYNGIDKAIYTDEEKADMAMKQAEHKLKLIPLIAPFKVAQRFLAIAFTVNFILAFWVGVAIWWFGTNEQLTAYIKIISVFELGWIMLAIISFYFGGGFVESWKNKNNPQ